MAKRLEWLSRAPQFSMHPYQYLAKVLRESGDTDGSRRIILAMEHKRVQVKGTGRAQKVKAWILHWTIGYGQMPLWALRWIFALFVVGAVVFGLGYLGGGITPHDREAYESFVKDRYPPAYCAQFNPLLYSFEHSFPLVNLGVKDRWAPNAGALAAPPIVNRPEFQWLQDNRLTISTSGYLRFWMWLQTVLGWLFATLFVAGLTGIVKST